tara:strand:+ start:6272 stop:6577 length:306 start_codon:yes stop_codon:yes gene_type:complete
MAVETSDDRKYLLADFGVVALYTPVGGAQVSITVIFDNEYEAVDAGGSVAFAMQLPKILCRSADVTGVSEGAAIVIDGTSYVVRVIMPDGTGMTELMLEAQ